MKLRTVVIDDEPIALEKLRTYAEKVPFLELVAACRNGIEAMEVITRESIDAVFTDINMPDMNGLEFIGSLSTPPLVVFITAYSDYAVDSYRFSAVDYLLKPYGFADFQRAANKVLQQYNLRKAAATTHPQPTATAGDAGDSIFVKVDYRFVRVQFSQIIYIKGYGEYLQIFLKGEKSPIVTLSSFNAIKEKLPACFIQIHRSYVINADCVGAVSKGRVVMDDGTDIPIGDSYRAAFQSYLSSRAIGAGKK